jgi:DNA-binding HxlR family transcriptional regulator
MPLALWLGGDQAATLFVAIYTTLPNARTCTTRPRPTRTGAGVKRRDNSLTLQLTPTSKAAKSAAAVRSPNKRPPLRRLLDLLGRRGCLRILWELHDGSGLTFRALSAAAELPPATLNTRLSELREAGLLLVEEGYRLSPLGLALVDSMRPLHAWSTSWAKLIDS